MTSLPLRFGLVGTGYWARVTHAPALASTDGHRPAGDAVADRLTELAANARSGHVRHPCDVWFGRDLGRVLAEAQRQLDKRAAT